MGNSRIQYTGIGSRETPMAMQGFMTKLAGMLEQKGYVLRSGGARGADKAFELGVFSANNKEIYLPDTMKIVGKETWSNAVRIVLGTHPNPRAAMKYINLLGRSAFQVLGKSLDEPSKFVICWTIDGKDSGGTGTAIRVAITYGIPVYNLHGISSSEILEMVKSIPKN